MILGFAHPGIVVPDLEQAREFYERALGFRVIGAEGWSDNPDLDRAIGLEGSAARGYMMAGHNCFLELWAYDAPEQGGPEPGSLGAHEPGIRHLAFYVDNCAEEYARLEALGGIHMGEPVGTPGEGSAVYLRDPFGNLIELAEVPSEQEQLTQLPGVNAAAAFTGRGE